MSSQINPQTLTTIELEELVHTSEALANINPDQSEYWLQVRHDAVGELSARKIMQEAKELGYA